MKDDNEKDQPEPMYELLKLYISPIGNIGMGTKKTASEWSRLFHGMNINNLDLKPDWFRRVEPIEAKQKKTAWLSLYRNKQSGHLITMNYEIQNEPKGITQLDNCDFIKHFKLEWDE